MSDFLCPVPFLASATLQMKPREQEESAVLDHWSLQWLAHSPLTSQSTARLGGPAEEHSYCRCTDNSSSVGGWRQDSVHSSAMEFPLITVLSQLIFAHCIVSLLMTQALGGTKIMFSAFWGQELYTYYFAPKYIHTRVVLFHDSSNGVNMFSLLMVCLTIFWIQQHHNSSQAAVLLRK